MVQDLFDEQPWYAVRCLFRTARNQPWGPSDLESGESAYEERITLWRANSFEEAIERAEVEASEYASAIEDDATEYIGLAQAFHLFGNPVDGAEIFSLARRSKLEPDDYLNHFFDAGGEYQGRAL